MNKNNWQEDVDKEIFKYLNDPYHLMNLASVLRAKAESIDIIVESPEVRQMIMKDPRMKG